jgi:hypothetical protein
VPRPRAPDEAAGRRWIHEGFPEGALISPDEPVRRISADFPEDAFISPDDPFRRRARMAGSSPGEPAVGDDVEITGIGESDPSYYRASAALQADVRDVGQAAQVLERLARRMREDGAAALLIEPGLARFDSVLRSFVAGYLAHARD